MEKYNVILRERYKYVDNTNLLFQRYSVSRADARLYNPEHATLYECDFICDGHNAIYAIFRFLCNWRQNSEGEQNFGKSFI